MTSGTDALGGCAFSHSGAVSKGDDGRSPKYPPYFIGSDHSDVDSRRAVC